MKSIPQVHLSDVQAIYSGPEGRLWELIMGEQIHIGGLQSSMDLAERAGVGPGQQGVDLCCATGAGMRFLARFRNVGRMVGVDATPTMLDLGRRRCAEEGLADRISFVEANVCTTGLPASQFDFVWGEDAWCYVEDKAVLIAEAARLIKPKGRIAFTDWMEGSKALAPGEAGRYLGFMKFPSVLSLADYRALLEQNGCTVRVAADTGRFAGYVPLYINMIEEQLTYDALKIIGYDAALAQTLLGEMRFMQSVAEAGKIIQGLIVAEKGVG
jgi:ubiquinone/menaquinone biosynthesis C-methylase UbiE